MIIRRDNEREQTQALCQFRTSLCPICTGAMVPARGSMRCTRCGFNLCVGCEATRDEETQENE